MARMRLAAALTVGAAVCLALDLGWLALGFVLAASEAR